MFFEKKSEMLERYNKAPLAGAKQKGGEYLVAVCDCGRDQSDSARDNCI